MTNGIRFDSVTVAYDGTVVLDSLDLTVESEADPQTRSTRSAMESTTFVGR